MIGCVGCGSWIIFWYCVLDCSGRVMRCWIFLLLVFCLRMMIMCCGLWWKSFIRFMLWCIWSCVVRDGLRGWLGILGCFVMRCCRRSCLIILGSCLMWCKLCLSVWCC